MNSSPSYITFILYLWSLFNEKPIRCNNNEGDILLAFFSLHFFIVFLPACSPPTSKEIMITIHVFIDGLPTSSIFLGKLLFREKYKIETTNAEVAGGIIIFDSLHFFQHKI